MIQKKEKDGAGLTVLGIILSLFFSLLLLGFIAVFHNSIPGWFGNEYLSKWLYFIPLSTFLVAVFQCLGFWFNRKSEYRTIAGANLTQSVVNSAVKLSVSKVLLNGGGLMTGAIVGQVIGALIYTGRLLKNGLSIFRHITLSELKNLAKTNSFFPRFSMFHKLINNFSSSLPVFVFSLYFSADIVGYFGLGFMLINRPMNLLSTSFTKVFSQRIIAKHNEGKLIYSEIKKFIVRMGAIAVIPFIIVIVFAPWLVTFIFGDNWYEAGVFMRIFAPWLFVVFLTIPLIFLGDMLSRQKKAMWIEVIKFGLRFGALAIGVYMQDVYLSLILFSGFSLLVVSYSLFWYLKLARKADESKHDNM
jgi:O-antigen/teichoic acid export membrane protein